MNHLTFYVRPKDGGKPIDIISFGRSSEVYQYFSDQGHNHAPQDGQTPEVP